MMGVREWKQNRIMALMLIKDLQYSENIINNYVDVWNEYIHNYNTGDSNAPDNERDGFIH